MTVKDLIARKGTHAAIISPNASISRAIHHLSQDDTSALIVVDDRRAILGILSASNIVTYLHRHCAMNTQLKAVDVMTHDVITCRETDSLAHVQQLMTQHHIRHVPVVRNGVLYGVITTLDLVNDRTRRAEAEVIHIRNYVAGAALMQ